MADFGSVRYDITKTLGVLSDDGKWRMELNLVSWNGREAKLDLRKWSPEHDKMSKGITMSREEARKLAEILNETEL